MLKASIKKNNHFLNFFMIIGALVFVFVSSDANINYQTDVTLFFRKMFYSGFYHPRLFKLIDYLFIIIVFLLVRNYGFDSNKQKVLQLIWVLTIFNTIFIFINPNHNAEYMFFGLPLISDVSVYTSLLFMFVLFFIKEEGLIHFIQIFAKYVIYFAVIKSIMLLIYWLIGQGFYFWGYYSILMEEDNLLLLSFLQLIVFYLYVSSKEKKFLYIWLLFILIEILSFRRSGLFVSILTLFVFQIYRYLKGTSLLKKLGFTLSISVLFFIMLNTIQYLPTTPKMYLGRYLGEFIQIPGLPSHLELFNNKHLEQAEYGLTAAIDVLPFWGYGFGHDIDKATISYGSNSAIHNSYVAVWMYHSLFYSIYLFLLAIIVLYLLIKYMFLSKWTSFNALIGIYLAVFFINHWVLPMANVIEIKMIIFRTILFTLLLRITPNNLPKILGSN